MNEADAEKVVNPGTPLACAPRGRSVLVARTEKRSKCPAADWVGIYEDIDQLNQEQPFLRTYHAGMEMVYTLSPVRVSIAIDETATERVGCNEEEDRA